ncbi:MAG: tRNA (adenosine(37)-N6)-threonylcarbamoyltransferase complex ATPase subunit type 1 TsaE [Pelagibacteraceae bacterium]|nr:tRNA (adenosine(37)-N6)-threonylcarbamoyltransferase complex ATPase subunit type 1 TsaE [Pelagibacteraceae bacterium]
MREEILTLDLIGLEHFCEDISLKIKVGDIICLFGELGSGKTTFARNLINSVYKRNKLKKPTSIKSPSYPILLTYEVNNFEIYHYDLYRISKSSELAEINIFEELHNSITIIEWPDVILDSLKDYNFYSLNLTVTNENSRNIKHNFFFN